MTYKKLIVATQDNPYNEFKVRILDLYKNFDPSDNKIYF